MTDQPSRSVRPAPCSICGDTEPFHVHDRGERIEDYFTVGRGQSDFEAAQAWKRRALDAEKQAGAEALRAASAYSEPRPAPLARPDEPSARRSLWEQKR